MASHEQSPKSEGRGVWGPHERTHLPHGEAPNLGVGETFHRAYDSVEMTGTYRCNGTSAVCPHHWTTQRRRNPRGGSSGRRHRVRFPELPEVCNGTGWVLEQPEAWG
jgi:hypothetical protein